MRSGQAATHPRPNDPNRLSIKPDVLAGGATNVLNFCLAWNDVHRPRLNSAVQRQPLPLLDIRPS